jgi:hypothetical protein
MQLTSTVFCIWVDTIKEREHAFLTALQASNLVWFRLPARSVWYFSHSGGNKYGWPLLASGNAPGFGHFWGVDRGAFGR